MKEKTELPIALTAKDWKFIGGGIDETSRFDRINTYAQLVVQKNLALDTPLDLEHRQYLLPRDWGIIRDIIRKHVGHLAGGDTPIGDSALLSGWFSLDEGALLQPRRIFCYSCNEECISYTLDDFFDERRTQLAVPDPSEEAGGNNEFVEWRDDCWHYSGSDGRRWYDDGPAESKYASVICKNWLLAVEDVGDVMKISPDRLDEILRKKAREKPEEVQKALESKRMSKWELFELCYAEVSVRLFRQLGFTSEEDVAKALQEEYFFHFGSKPAVCSYDHIIHNETERLLIRFQKEEDVKEFLSPGYIENAKLVLPAERK